MNSASFIKIVFIYLIIVFAVLLWSGSNKTKSIYDQYLISFSGLQLNIKDPEIVKNFLVEFLEFEQKSEDSYLLPDKRKIIFTRYQNIEAENNPSNPIILISVRNGINQLHQKFKSKNIEFDNNSNKRFSYEIKINEIEKSDGRTYFTIIGPGNLKFQFSQKTLF